MILTGMKRVMMGTKRSNRKTQHRPAEERSQTKVVQELRSENQSLRKQIARMRRGVQRVTDQLNTEPDPEPALQVSKDMESRCGKCNSKHLKQFKTPSGSILVVCQDCDHRTITKVNND